MPNAQPRPDKMEEACGVFGIVAPGEDVARLAYMGLYGLQHRGQESAGIAVSSGDGIGVWKDMGLVQQVFDERTLGILRGSQAIGHVRYSTTGDSNLANAQPIRAGAGRFQLALGHNGNLVNHGELRADCQRLGIPLQGTSDSEPMVHLIQHYWEQNRCPVEEALEAVLPRFKGAYSLVILTPTKVIGVRDPFGIRPLVLGEFQGNPVIASETCALDLLKAQTLREVPPGEMVVLTPNHFEFFPFAQPASAFNRLCIFEYIYFARPDSYLQGELLNRARQRMGELLAREHAVEADLVMPVPDSGTPHAIGYAAASGIPYQEGLVKNRYVGRTFINPDANTRADKVRLKLNPLREVIGGQRVILVDDSVVRGNTSKEIIAMLRRAGAKEVHLRVASPPVLNPCHYGIDTASTEGDELIANRLTLEQLRQFLGADSLGYLSREGLFQAAGNTRDHYCDACLSGDYPVPPGGELQVESKTGLGAVVPAE